MDSMFCGCLAESEWVAQVSGSDETGATTYYDTSGGAVESWSKHILQANLHHIHHRGLHFFSYTHTTNHFQIYKNHQLSWNVSCHIRTKTEIIISGRIWKPIPSLLSILIHNMISGFIYYFKLEKSTNNNLFPIETIVQNHRPDSIVQWQCSNTSIQAHNTFHSLLSITKCTD